MAKARSSKAAQSVGGNKAEKTLDFGTISDKQRQFLESTTFYTCYGGARGGGKSHIARIAAVLYVLKFVGIRVLMIRCHYPELEENLIRPILRWVPEELYSYNGSSHLMTFKNGSIIKFGHYDGLAAENEYQGCEYDIVFIDEATQIDERAFQYLGTIIRGTNDFPKRMYLTCNPGGVGHRWVKRLFIDRKFKTNCSDAEENEIPENYTFIPATLDDNPWLIKSSPMYKQQLAALPEDKKMAHRYGDWDALSGAYFKNFSSVRNIIEPFKIPDYFPRYASCDYGYDMYVICWWAVDEDGRSYCYRYFEKKGLVVKDAAKMYVDLTPINEKVEAVYMPPDLWAKSKDTGKELVSAFLENNIPVVKASNNRIHGHSIMKDMMCEGVLKDRYVRDIIGEKAPETMPMLMFFKGIAERCTDDICDIQADETNPEDCAKIPHGVTHSVDAVRYYCISRTMAAAKQGEEKAKPAYDDDPEDADYDDYMCGGEADNEYIDFFS